MIHSTQLDLFKSPKPIAPSITYVDRFLQEHKEFFDFLKANIRWNHQFQSRKTATFGVSYGYNGKHYQFRTLPEFLDPLCDQIEEHFAYRPNSCLINNYPDGNHYISYHSDGDMEMNKHTGVSIVSLGIAREMAFRNISDPSIKCYYPLQPGSAIYMDDAVQTDWQHGIPKTKALGHRISLSFRSLIVR
ncbi:MAG: alpha-ketoglutarate-dependent dioxygenase AlkB [Gammaproteobacteria bacterium]|nr:alpha-ketoglutarate-dependent dioxygenase AlkB [Gammaproteobacteria bacterium]